MTIQLATKSDAVQPFKRLLERFSALAQKEGVSVVPYSDLGPIHFQALPLDRQLATLDNFSRYVSVCEEAAASGESLKENGQVLWRMFNRMGFRPVSTLMDEVTNDIVVEMYDRNYVQIFRNLRFFEFCSYTIDELLCRPFWELFRREESLTPQMLEKTGALFGGQICGTYQWDVGIHVVDEIESPYKYRGVVKYKFISPLHDASGQVAAMINTFEIISYTRMVP